MSSAKNAIVTGSTSGIGLGIAHSLAQSGMNIMLNGSSDAAKVENIRYEMAQKYDVKVLYCQANMLNPDEINNMIEQANEKLGQVDIVVNNAGIQHVSPIEEFPVEKWDAIIAINLTSAFHTTRLVFEGMKNRRWGRIINIASAHALVASPYKAAYVAAKHGLNGLTKTTALEGAQYGITVNAICPGYVLTPLVEKQIPDTAKARGITEEDVKRDVLLAAQPTKQFVSTEQLGQLAVFLCSDAAASITGSALPVDGGWTAQ